MSLTQIQGVIVRRMLINFRADPKVVEKILPAPFKPQFVDGQAVVGICLIRLADLRPGIVPQFLGLHSENAAHRIAVEWTTKAGDKKVGVYIPRRDTSLWLNTVVGGRIFPGVHHQAVFNVNESENEYHVAFKSAGASVKVDAEVSDTFPSTSIFKSIKDSSEFFKAGALGYSPGFKEGQYQGLELITEDWKVKSLNVKTVESSFFSDEKTFPKGSIHFDHGLLMKDLKHSWRVGERLD